MNSLWPFCFVSGFLAVVAGSWSWDWLFASRQSRGIIAILGKKGARIGLGVLGVLLVGLGIYLGNSNHWALTERVGPEVIVEGTLPGENAKVVSEAIAVPLDTHFDQLPGVRLIVSESRSDGGFRDSLLFDPRMNPLEAKQWVENDINASAIYLPKSTTQGFTDELATPKGRSGRVSIAIVAKTDEVNAAALEDFAHAVQMSLAAEQAMADPLPLDNQLPDRAGIAKLVIHVNRNPAMRIAGSPPLGKSLSWARARCLILAELERKKRPDGQNFEVVNLGDF